MEQHTFERHILCENSALNNKWVIKQKPYELIESIRNHHNLSYLCATVLAARDIAFDQIEKFLDPNIKHSWQDPLILPDISRAVQLLQTAISQKQTIGIIGDYDVDGISASVLWKDIFDQLDIKTHVWLPNRKDGYGPSAQTINFFTQNKVDCIIMVDCGSSAHEFIVEFVRQMPDIQMVVIDHHVAKLDDSIAGKIIVNPHRKDINQLEQGEFLSLCATAISFLVAHQLLKEHPRKQEILKSLLDLVALATICDIMPMTALNRALVAHGLKILETQQRVGIKILMQKSQVKFPLTSEDIGFYIGPRLNAAGRMGDAHVAFQLLNTCDDAKAIELVAQLEKLNKERKIIQQYAFDEAEKMVVENGSIICLSHENWHAGVIGIVAAMVQEKFARPAIIGAIQGKYVKASARSQLLHIGNLIQKAALEERVLAGGGHQCAGGLTCTLEQWPLFVEWINEQAAEQTFEKPAIIVDAVTDLDQIEKDFLKLAPHGPAHPEVIVFTKNIRVQSAFDAPTYVRFSVLQNFKNYTFFMQKRKSALIDLLKQACDQRQELNMLVKLGQKGFNNIEDIVVL